jgi:hypothetical protein
VTEGVIGRMGANRYVLGVLYPGLPVTGRLVSGCFVTGRYVTGLLVDVHTTQCTHLVEEDRDELRHGGAGSRVPGVGRIRHVNRVDPGIREYLSIIRRGKPDFKNCLPYLLPDRHCF